MRSGHEQSPYADSPFPGRSGKVRESNGKVRITVPGKERQSGSQLPFPQQVRRGWRNHLFRTSGNLLNQRIRNVRYQYGRLQHLALWRQAEAGLLH